MGKYRALTLKQKLQILKEVDRHAKSKTAIALQYGIPKSSLSTIIKDRKKIEQATEKGLGLETKRMRSAAYPQLEEALLEWIKKIRSKNLPVDGNILKAKAEEFALLMGIEDKMKFSDGWVQNFKKRFNLTFRKVCGESAAADCDAAKAWIEQRIPEILAEYDPNDIYNSDETGLFFKALPNRTFAMKNERCSGGKLSKLRISVLLTSNMTGTDKCKLFVIGKSQKPRCFKGIKSLPVKYAANSTSWMTALLFTDWVRELDRRMCGQKRNIFLLMDNCPSHVAIDGLTSVKIEFLPPNVTSLIQPMDQGIIQSFKRSYKKMLLQRMLISIDNGREYSVDLLKAVYMAAAAWDSVTAKTIENCFRHAGFRSDVEAPVVSDDAEADDGDELLCALKRDAAIPEDLTFENFVKIDDNVECSADLTDEEIVRRVTEARASDSEDSEEEQETQTEIVRPSVKATTDAIDVIRRFLQEETGTEEFLNMTNVLEKKVLSLAAKNMKQKKITDFLV